MWKRLAIQALAALLPQISSSLRAAMGTVIADLEKRAKETSNEFDDIAVALLKALLGE